MRRVTLLLCASLALILTSCLGPGGGLSGNWSRVYEATFTTTDTTDAVVYSKEDYRVRIDILDITKEQGKTCPRKVNAWSTKVQRTGLWTESVGGRN